MLKSNKKESGVNRENQLVQLEIYPCFGLQKDANKKTRKEKVRERKDEGKMGKERVGIRSKEERG